MLDGVAAYRALKSRDNRFDGIFYVGVTSTGVYCRPICPARTPRQENCRFFATAEGAEKASFRPCLRCRPELAPGTAPVDDARRVAHLLVDRLQDGWADSGHTLDEIAAHFELSSRQLRRVVQQELGVSPIELLQTRRLLLAKQLLTETQLPITEIAFASGYSSLRRFNGAFLSRYRMPPTRLRKQTTSAGSRSDPADTASLQLSYRPPLHWTGMLEFLQARMMADVECVVDDSYCRTVRLGAHRGWIAVRHLPSKNVLTVQFARTLTPALPALLSRLRNLFDLSARPDLIAAHLRQDKSLRADVRRHPGLRVPGAFDGFELAVRAILGQQITVRAATTLAGRFASTFGEEIRTPFAGLSRLSPVPAVIASANVDAIASLGIISARARCILALARAFESGDLRLDAGANAQEVMERLMAIPGIGPWTAHYIAMRALRWPDAFPTNDVAILKNLGGITQREAEAMSQRWRPWRSYAVLHIWGRKSA